MVLAAAVISMDMNEAKPGWWAALLLTSLAGLAAGIWCGFFCEYQPSERLKVYSFPFPIGIWHLENGQWVDYVSPYGILVGLLDVVVVGLACVLPVASAYLLSRGVRRLRAGRA